MLLTALTAAMISKSSWTLALGGDVMLNGVSPKVRPLEAVAADFSAADLSILNLEIPLTTATERTPHKSRAAIARRDQFVLKADPAHIVSLSRAGIDAVSLANNHAMDYGVDGLLEMRSLLRGAGIASAGAGERLAEAEKPALVRVKGGLRVAIVSRLAFRSDAALNACGPASESRPGIAVLRFGGIVDSKARVHLRKLASSAQREADFTILALHWGLERQQLPTSYQVALGRAAVEAGFDLVVGHHPHVLQGAEIYRGKAILYSLGNIVSPIGGTTAILRLRLRGAVLERVELVPCRIAGGKVEPMPAPPARSALASFRALCGRIQSAFPNRESKVPQISLVATDSSDERRQPYRDGNSTALYSPHGT